jgi:glycine oxidase
MLPGVVAIVLPPASAEAPRYDRLMAGVGHTSQECDVVIVGAGVIGCAVAHELARRGLRTVVVEARAVGRGATQASAGVLAPFIEAPAEGPLQALTVESLGMYDRFVATVSEEANLPVEYRRCGTIEVARDSGSVRRLKTLGEWARSRGVDARWVEASEIGRLEPALAPTSGGLIVSEHGYVRVGQLTDALAAAARRHGAAIHDSCRAEQLSSVGDGVRLTTSDGAYRARFVVVAAGSWSGAIAPETEVIPVRGQLLYVKWQGPAITRVLWSDHCYLVPWVDGTLLVGATVEHAGFDERVTAAGVQQLLNAASEVLPGIADATFIEARVGLRPATPTGLPTIRRSAEHPSIIYATGHFRNGILLAPLTARLVAELIC